MKRIFITGGSGMLGSYTAVQAAEAGWETRASCHAHPVSLPGCEMVKLDLADHMQVSKAVRKINPQVIVHTAAQSKPDVCEQDHDNAILANQLSTCNIAKAAEEVGAHLVYISTDLVFPGSDHAYKEENQPVPPNYYGMTKLAGERAVMDSSGGWAVVRTSIIYGPRMFPHLNSFSDKVIGSLRSGKSMTAFTDQRRCPIPAWNLADVLLEIADRRLTGIFHAVCPESSTRYEFAVKVAETFGLDASFIQPVTMDQVPSAGAFRPKTLILDTTSTQARLNTRLLGFEEGIRGLLNRKDAKDAKNE